MAKPYSELQARMTKKAREESDRTYLRLSAEMALQDIRTAAGLSQEQMAKRLKVNQAQVSRIESRLDARVSTLSKYVQAAGGKLRMVADIRGRMVEISFGDYGPAEDTRRTTSRGARGKTRSRSLASA